MFSRRKAKPMTDFVPGDIVVLTEAYNNLMPGTEYYVLDPPKLGFAQDHLRCMPYPKNRTWGGWNGWPPSKIFALKSKMKPQPVEDPRDYLAAISELND